MSAAFPALWDYARELLRRALSKRKTWLELVETGSVAILAFVLPRLTFGKQREVEEITTAAAYAVALPCFATASDRTRQRRDRLWGAIAATCHDLPSTAIKQ